MTIRQRRQHEVPTLNTSSLPDLIFTVLFFFMIVTHMRKVTLKVEYALPQGTELTRLTKSKLSRMSILDARGRKHLSYRSTTSWCRLRMLPIMWPRRNVAWLPMTRCA